MVLFYKIWEQYNEMQLTKNMDLNNIKNDIIHIIQMTPLINRKDDRNFGTFVRIAKANILY